MKICIPVEKNMGLDSNPYSHFGSAPLFIIYDLESDEITELNNQDLNHEHGKCQPLKALSGTMVDAVIVGGIGQGAINKLNSMNIKIYKATKSTIKENLELYKQNKLTEFPQNHTCNHDGCNHH